MLQGCNFSIVTAVAEFVKLGEQVGDCADWADLGWRFSRKRTVSTEREDCGVVGASFRIGLIWARDISCPEENGRDREHFRGDAVSKTIRATELLILQLFRCPTHSRFLAAVGCR
jgi:hypothetical protein